VVVLMYTIEYYITFMSTSWCFHSNTQRKCSYHIPLNYISKSITALHSSSLQHSWRSSSLVNFFSSAHSLSQFTNFQAHACTCKHTHNDHISLLFCKKEMWIKIHADTWMIVMKLIHSSWSCFLKFTKNILWAVI